MPVLKYKNSAGEYVALTNYAVQPITIFQSTGDSTEGPMSQKAVTEALDAISAGGKTIVYGTYDSETGNFTDSEGNVVSPLSPDVVYKDTETNKTYTTVDGGTTTLVENESTVVTTENLTTTLNNYATIGSIPTETTVSGWGFTKNEGTVTAIKVGTDEALSPSNGVVTLPAYPAEVTDSTISDWGYTKNNLALGEASDTAYAGNKGATAYSYASNAKTETDYLKGVNTNANITSVPIDKRTVICADISTTNQQTFALNETAESTMADGHELHIIGKATANAKIAFTTDSTHICMTASPLEVASGKYYEINVLRANGVYYIRGVVSE